MSNIFLTYFKIFDNSITWINLLTLKFMFSLLHVIYMVYKTKDRPKGARPLGPIFFFFTCYIFNFLVVGTPPPPKKNLRHFSSPISLIQLATIQPKNLIKTITAFRTVIVFQQKSYFTTKEPKNYVLSGKIKLIFL